MYSRRQGQYQGQGRDARMTTILLPLHSLTRKWRSMQEWISHSDTSSLNSAWWLPSSESWNIGCSISLLVRLRLVITGGSSYPDGSAMLLIRNTENSIKARYTAWWTTDGGRSTGDRPCWLAVKVRARSTAAPTRTRTDRLLLRETAAIDVTPLFQPLADNRDRYSSYVVTLCSYYFTACVRVL